MARKPAPFPGNSRPVRGRGKVQPGKPAKPPSRGRRKPAPFPGSSADMKPGTGGPVGAPTLMPTKPGRGKGSGGKIQPGRPAKPPTRGRRKPVPMPIGPTKPVRGKGRRKPTPMPVKPTKPGRPVRGKIKPVRGKLK